MYAIAVMAISRISIESRQNGTAVVPDNSCLQHPPNHRSRRKFQRFWRRHGQTIPLNVRQITPFQAKKNRFPAIAARPLGSPWERLSPGEVLSSPSQTPPPIGELPLPTSYPLLSIKPSESAPASPQNSSQIYPRCLDSGTARTTAGIITGSSVSRLPRPNRGPPDDHVTAWRQRIYQILRDLVNVEAGALFDLFDTERYTRS